MTTIYLKKRGSVIICSMCPLASGNDRFFNRREVALSHLRFHQSEGHEVSEEQVGMVTGGEIMDDTGERQCPNKLLAESEAYRLAGIRISAACEPFPVTGEQSRTERLLRDDIPWLLALVKRQREEIERLRDLVAHERGG